MKLRKSTLWLKAIDDAVHNHNWTKHDFIKFISPQKRGCDFKEHPEDFSGSLDSPSYKSIPDEIASEFSHRSGANMAEAFNFFAAILGKPSKIERKFTKTEIPKFRETKFIGIDGGLRPEMMNDMSALYTTVDIMMMKFGQNPKLRSKWQKWLKPACNPKTRWQDANAAFEIHFEVKLPEFKRENQYIARSMRRNIRQLLLSNRAPVNNHMKMNKLGNFLLEHLREDLTMRQQEMMDRAKQKYNTWIAAGYVSPETTSLSPGRRKKKQPAQTRQIKTNIITKKKQKKVLSSTEFASKYINDMIVKPFQLCEKPDLEKIHTKIQVWKEFESNKAKNKALEHSKSFKFLTKLSENQIPSRKSLPIRPQNSKMSFIPYRSKPGPNIEYLEKPSSILSLSKSDSSFGYSSSSSFHSSKGDSVKSKREKRATIVELFSRAESIMGSMYGIRSLIEMEDEEEEEEEKQQQEQVDEEKEAEQEEKQEKYKAEKYKEADANSDSTFKDFKNDFLSDDDDGVGGGKT